MRRGSSTIASLTWSSPAISAFERPRVMQSSPSPTGPTEEVVAFFERRTEILAGAATHLGALCLLALLLAAVMPTLMPEGRHAHLVHRDVRRHRVALPRRRAALARSGFFAPDGGYSFLLFLLLPILVGATAFVTSDSSDSPGQA